MLAQDSKLYKLCRHLQTEEMRVFKDPAISDNLIKEITEKINDKPKSLSPFTKINIAVVLEDTESFMVFNQFLGHDGSDTEVDIDELYEDVYSSFPNVDFSRHPFAVLGLIVTGAMKKLARKAMSFIPTEPYSLEDISDLYDLFVSIYVMWNNPEEVNLIYQNDNKGNFILSHYNVKLRI